VDAVAGLASDTPFFGAEGFDDFGGRAGVDDEGGGLERRECVMTTSGTFNVRERDAAVTFEARRVLAIFGRQILVRGHRNGCLKSVLNNTTQREGAH
jgi:hypothetical protein